MPALIVDPGGGAGGVKGTADGDSAGMITIDNVNATRLVGALALVMMDYINDVRADPLTVKAAKTATDILTDMKAKL